MFSKIKKALVVFLSSLFMHNTPSMAAEVISCVDLLNGDVSASTVSSAVLKPSQIKLSDIAATNSSNPMIQYPGMVMTAGQKYWLILNEAPSRKIKDPVYGVEEVTVYPAFSGEMNIPGVSMIVGQFKALEGLANHIASAARGDKGGKIFGVVGPSGTGKTEAFNVLDSLRRELAKKSPLHTEITFKWVGLERVPALSGLVPRQLVSQGIESSIDPDLKRSPFTLLRSDIQEDVLTAIRSPIEQKIGFHLQAWRLAAPKDIAIIEEIMKHTYKSVRDQEVSIDELSVDDYINALEPYVKIVPRTDINTGASDIVRFLGANPNFERLYVAQDPLRTVYYTAGSPLAYNYTGTVLRNDGRGLVFDEAPRNEKEVLDSFLDLAQNGVAQSDGPPVAIDVVTMFTGNDQSITSAKENGDLHAFIDRSHIVPMRLNLHPWEVAKLAVLMVGTKQFRMQKIGTGKTEKIEPLDINKVFPLPDEQGKIPGLHRRYALYYVDSPSAEPLLISPHTLELLALTASISRLVVDAKIFKTYPSEFGKLNAQSAYFENPVSRLKLILGLDSVQTAVRAEIAKFSALAREGEVGISSRDTQSWLKQALSMAHAKNVSALTPEIVDAAFKSLLNEGTIAVPNSATRTQWLNRYALVKSAFTLPGLHRDIQEIIAGHGERANRLYDTIVGEIIALSEDPEAKTWTPDNEGAAQSINKERFEKIKVIYKRLHNVEFSPGFLLSHLGRATKGERHPQLLAAVEAFLTENESDILDNAKQFMSYLKGENVSPDVQRQATAIASRLSNYGYNESSFHAAMEYLRILEAEMQQRLKAVQ